MILYQDIICKLKRMSFRNVDLTIYLLIIFLKLRKFMNFVRMNYFKKSVSAVQKPLKIA